MLTTTKLGLQLPTDPRWVDLTAVQLEDILTDHAYCEQKAASTCISLIQQYPEREELVDKLSSVVAEEWSHFRAVLKELKKRGLKLGRQRKDEYVNALMKVRRKYSDGNQHLAEKLLLSALIEARSCERFRLLSIGLEDPELKQFYHQFMVAEAGHYKMFLHLAKLYAGASFAEERWRTLLEEEADIMKSIETRGDRMH